MHTGFKALGLLLAAVVLLQAELLDRIAITVGNQVITEQEIYEQLRIAAFLDGKEPQFTQQQLRDTADRMVLQRLVVQDMDANGFEPPTEEEVAASFAESRALLWGSEEEFTAAAASAKVSREAVMDFIKSMVATMKYIEFRFRPAVRVTDAALLERYQEKYNALDPEAGDPPPFEDVRDALEAEITDESVNRVVERWLEDASTRAGVRYKPEVIP